MTRLLLFLLLALQCSAAVRYVRTDGDNGHDGTENTAAKAWATIAYAESQLSEGDTVYVADGTYNERVTINQSGSAGNFINYVGNSTGTGVVMYGFVLDSASYIRIIGFEIRHTDTSYNGAFALQGTTSYLHVLDNYVHEIEGPFLWALDGCSAHHLVVRGNIVYWVAHPGSYRVGTGAITGNYGEANTHQWLIEYNIIKRSGDYLNLYGSNSIARNNYLHDTRTTYWTEDGMHFDGFQSGSDGGQMYTRHQLYEANLVGDMRDSYAGANPTNAHFGLWQDNTGYGDTNILVRRNIGFEISSGFMGVLGAGHPAAYHNVAHQAAIDVAGGIFSFRWTSLNGWIANNIISDAQTYNPPIYIESGSTATVTNNLGWATYSDSSFVSTNDPKFNSTSGRDFRLQSDSPAKNAGTLNLIWVTSANGSGTTFNVNDGQLLCDGYGEIEGDLITLVGGSTTRVTSISGNAVTVADSVSWTLNQAVVYGTDTTPDIGAYSDGATFMTAATVSSNATTYTVSPTGDARMVWFYSNGIPWSVDYDAPYTATIVDGLIVAKAYALWAQTNPVVTADWTAGGSGSGTLNNVTIGTGIFK